VAGAGFAASGAADQTDEAAKPNSRLHNSTPMTARLIFPSVFIVAKIAYAIPPRGTVCLEKNGDLDSSAEFRNQLMPAHLST
jgi:hypothetical protein